jgi:hypothetical protein
MAVNRHEADQPIPERIWAALREAIAAATVTEAVPRHAAGQIVRGLTRLQTRPSSHLARPDVSR